MLRGTQERRACQTTCSASTSQAPWRFQLLACKRPARRPAAACTARPGVRPGKHADLGLRGPACTSKVPSPA